MTTLRVSCTLCRWTAEDEPDQALARQLRHRERRHGIVHGRRHRGSRGVGKVSFGTLSPEQQLEIDEAVRRRKRLLGIEEAA